MTFINLLLFILVGVGITNLVVNATVLDGIRDFIISKSGLLEKLLSCMMCSGFWVGTILALFIPEINIIYGGAIISLLSYVVGNLIDYLEVLITIRSKELEVESDE